MREGVMSIRRFFLIFAFTSFAAAALPMTAQSDVSGAAGRSSRGLPGARSFGAAADGQADDTAAIQAAIDHVAGDNRAGHRLCRRGKIPRQPDDSPVDGDSAHRVRRASPGVCAGSKHARVPGGPRISGNRPIHAAVCVAASGGGMSPWWMRTSLRSIAESAIWTSRSARAIRRRLRCGFTWRSTRFVQHMRFQVGDGRAALEDVGNGAIDLQIEGGEYGIISVRTSPAWQFLLMDSSIHRPETRGDPHAGSWHDAGARPHCA